MDVKKRYEKPEMKAHGDLKIITKGGVEGAGDGAGPLEPS